MLMKMGVDENLIKNLTEEILNIPFDEKQKLLLLKVLKALYDSTEFGSSDLKELYSLGFSDKDFFNLLSYASNFIAKSKMIEIYLK